jgi:hypothetical protein
MAARIAASKPTVSRRGRPVTPPFTSAENVTNAPDPGLADLDMARVSSWLTSAKVSDITSFRNTAYELASMANRELRTRHADQRAKNHPSL